MFNFVIRTARELAFAGVALAAVSAAPAFAQDSGELAVSAEVIAGCNVTTSPVAFGDVDVTTGSNVDAAGGISVTCNQGTDWTAAADAGEGSGALVTARKMTGASATLNYGLFTDEDRLVNFGGATTLGGEGTGVAVAVPIYGRVFANQTGVPSGSYVDSVTISLTY